MARIGNLTVDLTLKSAAFIRDMAKSSQAVATNTQRMTKSLNALTAGFGAVFSARLIRQIAGVTTESLKLAATMHGPLAESATKFLSQFEELQNSFQLGIATGFLDELNRGLGITEESLKEATTAGENLGTALAVAAKGVVFVFGTLIPDLASVADNAIQTALDKLHELRQEMQGLSFEGMQTRLGIEPEDTENLLAYGSAAELAALETEAFWSATVTATAFGEEHLRTLDAQEKILRSLQTPAEEYAAALDRIAAAQLSGEDAARAHSAATATLVGNYLQLADNIGTALGTMFKESKGVAIAQAIINTAQAITKTFAEYGATPWGFALAASMAAIGAAQIASIASSNPGSGSKAMKKSTGGAGAGAAATARAGSASRTAAASPGQTVTIKIVGDVFGPEHFRKIVAGINGVQRDGTALLAVA